MGIINTRVSFLCPYIFYTDVFIIRTYFLYVPGDWIDERRRCGVEMGCGAPARVHRVSAVLGGRGQPLGHHRDVRRLRSASVEGPNTLSGARASECDL